MVIGIRRFRSLQAIEHQLPVDEETKRNRNGTIVFQAMQHPIFIDKVLDGIPVIPVDRLFENLFQAFKKVLAVFGIKSLHCALSVKLDKGIVVYVNVINTIKAIA